MNTTNTISPPELKSHGPRRPRFIHLVLTDDEFSLMNWARFRHDPARLPDWALSGLIKQACESVKDHVGRGHKVPQEIAEIATRLKEVTPRF